MKNLVSLLILTTLIIQINSQLSSKILQTVTTVSSTSNHEITILFKNTDIGIGSYIIIQYSTQWILTSVTGGNTTSDYCQSGCTISSVTINKIANTIKINGLFPRIIGNGQSIHIRYTLKGIINPSYVMSQTITIFLYDNTASLLDLTTSSISTTPKQLSCSTTRTNTTVSVQTSYKFAINPNSFTLPSTTSIILDFPSQWFNSAQAGTFNPLTYGCSSSINPLISCTYTGSNINVTNILTASTTSIFQFTVNNIKNPGSQQINNQLIFYFYSTYSPSKQIAYCNVPISSTIAKSIPDFTLSLAGTMGSLIKSNILFTLTQKSKTTDLLQLQLPKQYNTSNLYTSFVYLNTQSVGRQATLYVNQTNNPIIINLLPFFTDSIALYKIQLYNIQLPKTSANIGAVKLSIFRNGALVAVQQCCSMQYSSFQYSSGLNIQLSTYKVGSYANHYLSLTSTSILKFPNDYTYIMISFQPSKYILSSSTYNCYIKNTQMIISSTPLTCTRNTSTSILISNFNISSTSLTTIAQSIKLNNNTFVIGIDSILTPITLSPLNLKLSTLDNNYNIIQSINTTYSLITQQIQSIKIYSTSYITYDTVSYTLTITNTNILNTNIIIIIIFPQQIHISTTSTCIINGTVLAISDCVIDATNMLAHKVTIYLKNTLSIQSSELNKTNITITSITNPLNIRQTHSFNVQLMLSDTLEVIQQLAEGVTITMTTPKQTFPNISIIPSDMHVLAITDYLVQYQLPIDIINTYGTNNNYALGGIYISVQLPQQFTCSALSTSTSSTTKPCLVSATQTSILTHTLSSTPALTTLIFTIPSVTNPQLVYISSPIYIRLYINNYISIQYICLDLNAFIQTTIYYTLTQSVYNIQQYSNVYINITSIQNNNNKIINTNSNSNISRYIQIHPPLQYSINIGLYPVNITCNYANSIIMYSTYGSSISSIKIDNITQPIIQSLQITISNIINPTYANTPSTNKWNIYYKQSNTDILIAMTDINTDIQFNIICTLPCRTCLSTNASYCLSCYTAIGSILQKYLDVSTNTCIQTCLANEYLSSIINDNICYICSSSCLTCANISDNCTSCASPLYLYQSTAKCISSCPPDYYPLIVPSRTCNKCVSPCKYCTGTTCTLCQSSYILTIYASNSSTTCTASCSSGYYNHSNICLTCPLTCQTCVSTSYCTTCISSLYLYNGSCVTSCPYSLYISIASGNTTCQLCQSPCLTCVEYSTYCISCNISALSTYKYLYTNINGSVNTSTCLNTCPIYHYYSQLYICYKCISPCLSCISPVSCTSCLPGYIYYANINTCYSICPNNTIQLTINSTQQCQQCISPCLTCSTSTSTCTTCIQTYFLDQTIKTCNSTCTLPYFAIQKQRKCKRCAQPCNTCVSLQPYACISCISGYYLLATSCYISCPAGTYLKQSTSTCQICTSGCLTCITSSSQCLSCYPGLYLYQQSCLPNCPTTPVYYYQYQMQCIACQPECLSCMSTPIECSACSSNTLYFNQVTRQCTLSCTSPYYAGVNASNPSIKLCIKCKQPCKTCTTTYNKCSTCYNGKYLYNQQCLDRCPLTMYSDMLLNKCISCSNNCQVCTSVQSCLTCISGTYQYQGGCYNTCPIQAPYVYINKYCRNCVLDHCLLCDTPQNNQKQSCLLCQPLFYLYQSKCISQCPQNYQPDTVTQSLCIQTQQSVYLKYLIQLQKYKVYLMPATIIFIIFIVYIIIYMIINGDTCYNIVRLFKYYNNNNNQDNNYQNIIYYNNINNNKYNIINTHIIHTCIAIPQTISIIIYLIYLSINPQTYFHSQSLNIIYYILFILYYLFNIIHFIIIYNILKYDKIFKQWIKSSDNLNTQQQNKNYKRYIIILVSMILINRKIFYILFSGFWRIPITCCQISKTSIDIISKKIKMLTIIGIIIVELPIIGYVIYTAMIQKYILNNYKLFYGTVDIVIIFVISIVIEIIFLVKQFIIPNIYKKYILEKISNRSLPALSQQVPEQQQHDDDDFKLHRSNSTDGLIKQSQQIKDIDFMSVFDPSDFQDPVFVESPKIQHAIKNGKYRKKNLKKKKKNRNLHGDLDIIDQDSLQSSEENVVKKNKKRRPLNMKKNKLATLNNFIYWKPPQKAEKKPQKQFKLHEKQIMQTIRQKQSDFDTLTRNDIIFQQQPMGQNSSHSSDPDFEIQDTRRALNYQYQAFLNKNYAKRRHLDG